MAYAEEMILYFYTLYSSILSGRDWPNNALRELDAALDKLQMPDAGAGGGAG